MRIKATVFSERSHVAVGLTSPIYFGSVTEYDFAHAKKLSIPLISFRRLKRGLDDCHGRGSDSQQTRHLSIHLMIQIWNCRDVAVWSEG